MSKEIWRGELITDPINYIKGLALKNGFDGVIAGIDDVAQEYGGITQGRAEKILGIYPDTLDEFLWGDFIVSEHAQPAITSHSAAASNVFALRTHKVIRTQQSSRLLLRRLWKDRVTYKNLSQLILIPCHDEGEPPSLFVQQGNQFFREAYPLDLNPEYGETESTPYFYDETSGLAIGIATNPHIIKYLNIHFSIGTGFAYQTRRLTQNLSRLALGMSETTEYIKKTKVQLAGELGIPMRDGRQPDPRPPIDYEKNASRIMAWQMRRLVKQHEEKMRFKQATE